MAFMRKMIANVFLLLMLFFIAFSVCQAEELDPILSTKESPIVFDCGDEFRLEIYSRPWVIKSVTKYTAINNYMDIIVKYLYLKEDEIWKGIDPQSFTLVYIDDSGSRKYYPVDNVVSMLSSRIKQYDTFGKTMDYPSYFTYELVFDVDTNKKLSWSLLFEPRERGASEPSCSIEIPLSDVGIDASAL